MDIIVAIGADIDGCGGLCCHGQHPVLKRGARP